MPDEQTSVSPPSPASSPASAPTPPHETSHATMSGPAIAMLVVVSVALILALAYVFSRPKKDVEPTNRREQVVNRVQERVEDRRDQNEDTTTPADEPEIDELDDGSSETTESRTITLDADDRALEFTTYLYGRMDEWEPAAEEHCDAYAEYTGGQTDYGFVEIADLQDPDIQAALTEALGSDEDAELFTDAFTAELNANAGWKPGRVCKRDGIVTTTAVDAATYNAVQVYVWDGVANTLTAFEPSVFTIDLGYTYFPVGGSGHGMIRTLMGDANGTSWNFYLLDTDDHSATLIEKCSGTYGESDPDTGEYTFTYSCELEYIP